MWFPALDIRIVYEMQTLLYGYLICHLIWTRTTPQSSSDSILPVVLGKYHRYCAKYRNKTPYYVHKQSELAISGVVLTREAREGTWSGQNLECLKSSDGSIKISGKPAWVSWHQISRNLSGRSGAPRKVVQKSVTRMGAFFSSHHSNHCQTRSDRSKKISGKGV